MHNPATLGIRSSALPVLWVLFWPLATLAQVPTASFEDEDATPAPAASSAPTQDTGSRSRPAPTDPAPGSGTRAASSVDQVPVSAGSVPAPVEAPANDGTPTPTRPAAASAPSASSSTVSSSGMAAFEERASGTATALRPGFARLSLFVSERGSTVFVTASNRANVEQPLESALVTCSTRCNVDLPLGRYTVWVKTADDTRSSRDFELRSSRWLSVAPANQIMRDFGFASGAVGSVATVLGLAILSGLICDSCTSTGRHVTGGLAFGLGLPMGAVGWSLYFIHREARIDDRILTQPEGVGSVTPNSSNGSNGALLQTRFVF